MMIAWLAAAFAVSPQELADAVPDAREQLTACEQSGCSDEDGASAAFVMAVSTYVDQGLADPVLAGTVRALSDELFLALPDVLQDGAGDAYPWALADAALPAVNVEAAVTGGVPSVAAATPAGKVSRVMFTVKDSDGKPIPTARIRLLGESEPHRVRRDNGRWFDTVAYLENGELPFVRDRLLEFEVSAPGYDRRQVKVTPHGKKHKVDTVLRATDRTGEPPNVAALYDRWIAEETALLDAYTDEASQGVEKTRRALGVEARNWADAEDTRAARSLCAMTQSLERCGLTSGSLARDQPVVLGAAKVASLEPVFQAHHDELASCAEGAADGLVQIRFNLSDQGNVVRAWSSPSGVVSPSVGACMANVVSKLKFPEPDSGIVIVSYPVRTR